MSNGKSTYALRSQKLTLRTGDLLLLQKNNRPLSYRGRKCIPSVVFDISLKNHRGMSFGLQELKKHHLAAF